MPADESATISTEHLPLIRASELAQYNFCRRTWWLGTIKGIPSRNQTALTRGGQIHRSHAYQVQTALRWRHASFFLLSGGGFLLIIALVWLLLTFNV
jgi:hypothetical protein